MYVNVLAARSATESGAIAENGVTIPTPVLTWFIGFGLGILLGPALLVSTEAGAKWIAEKARERLTVK